MARNFEYIWNNYEYWTANVMNITLTSLEALVLKATDEDLTCGHPDEFSVEAFWSITSNSIDGPPLAAAALAARIHSENPQEALLALSMLDQCMKRGDKKFLAEIGKFRFLNELIKLVSPKYLAGRTAPEVKMRVLQLIHAWSIEYPKEAKFKVAYDMLKNQGVICKLPPPIPREEEEQLRSRTKNAIFEDDEKSKLLQKLLQSKKPEDLQHANTLIKTMVREEEQRSEANSKRAQVVSAALDSAGLLGDMLEHASSATAEEEQLIHELHGSCTRLRPVLQRLAASDAQADNLDDILQASDTLDEVFEQYRLFTSEKTSKILASEDHQPQASASANGDTLLDFAGAQPILTVKKNSSNAIDELGDIFAAEPPGFNVLEPLKPVPDRLLTNEDTDLLGEEGTSSTTGAAPGPGPGPGPGGWRELDSLGEQLMNQSLPDRVRRPDGFNGKSKKVPMNALDKTSQKQETHSDPILDFDFFTKTPIESAGPPPTQTLLETDDVMVDISTNDNGASSSPQNKVTEPIIQLNDAVKSEKTKKDEEIKPLTDINVTISSVKPSKVPPITVFKEEEGLTVVFHFCKDRPRPDVGVVVVSTTSKKETPIDEYKFQAVVPKGCKVRLLPPSGTSLPTCNPFLPPPALTQVMLLAPLGVKDLKFVITYTSEDETHSEIGEVKGLSLEVV